MNKLYIRGNILKGEPRITYIEDLTVNEQDILDKKPKGITHFNGSGYLQMTQNIRSIKDIEKIVELEKWKNIAMCFYAFKDAKHNQVVKAIDDVEYMLTIDLIEKRKKEANK